jgi:hypothetical protein
LDKLAKEKRAAAALENGDVGNSRKKQRIDDGQPTFKGMRLFLETSQVVTQDD